MLFKYYKEELMTLYKLAQYISYEGNQPSQCK